MIIYTTLLRCFLLTSLLALNTYQTQANSVISYPDSGSLKLSIKAFEEKMAHYTDLMREESEFTTEEYIEMVLIDNTYFLFLRNGNQNYRVHAHQDYLSLLKKYMPDMLKALEANQQGCNGGNYSTKYNLCIGGTDPTSNSVYEIQE